jgi:hypothetical protein
MEKEQGLAVRDPDVADRLGVNGQALPEIEAGEHLRGTPGNRRGASVEGIRRRQRRGLAVDHRHAQADRAQGAGQRQADQSAAGHQHIDCANCSVVPTGWVRHDRTIAGWRRCVHTPAGQ